MPRPGLPHPPPLLQNASAAGRRLGRLGPSVPARLARGEGAQKCQVSPARSHPLCKVGGCTHTHTHTHTRARTPPARRGDVLLPPSPLRPAALPSCSAPAEEPAPNLLPGRPAEPLPLQPALELRC